MKIRRYAHEITVQQPVEVKDGNNTVVGIEWQNFITIPASVEPISGREFILLQNTNSELKVRIKTWYYPGVTNAMRVVYGNRIFNIQSIIDYKELHREMHLMCTEGEM